MPITFTSAGVAIQTFEEILAEIQEEFRVGISATLKTDLKSAAGQFMRIMATRDQQWQEKILQLYQSMDPRLAEGVHLDQRLAMLGVLRDSAASAEVLGTVTATNGTVITNGFRLSVGGYEFTVVDGPYTVVSGGELAGVRVRSTLQQEIDVSILGAWTLIDSIAGFTAFDDDEQPILGNLVESDAEYRAKAEIERFRRASSSLGAIEANVLAVEGVTYVRAYHNINPATDPNADGIPLHYINVVVIGGEDEEIALAIQEAMPAGQGTYGTSVSVILGTGTYAETIYFDRVTDINIWINGTLVTSTSEEDQLDDPEAAALEALGEYTTDNWSIGADVLPSRLAAVLANLQGVDSATAETSLTGGGGTYSSAKRSISIRQRAVYSDARTVIVES